MGRYRSLLVVGFGLTLCPSVAFAASADEAREEATSILGGVLAKLPKLRGAVQDVMQRTHSPERLLAAGELSLRSGEYARAIDILNMVVELHAQNLASPLAHANATFLLGESYFQDGQLLAAAREYRALVEHGSEHEYAKFVGRSLARLVDVSNRTSHAEILDFVLERLPTLTSDDALGSVAYATGKANFARGKYVEALEALSRVTRGAGFFHQAEYLKGVVLLKQAADLTVASEARRYVLAIDQFRRVTLLTADSDDHRAVVDLAWMAIARLHYESGAYPEATEAYAHVKRESREFHQMLYELSWVYIRLEDYVRAQRALEVLAIAAPDTLEIADGPLLRADLMLRSGQFDNALKLYQSVRARFAPVLEDLDELLVRTTDPAVYHDRLVRDAIGEDEELNGLPDVVTRWVREAAADDRVFAVIDDIGRSRTLARRSRDIVTRLTSLLGSSTRAQAFPEMKAQLQVLLGHVNALARARLSLVRGLDEETTTQTSALLATRQEREALAPQVEGLPMTESAFSARSEAGQRRWNRLSQKLQGLELEADRSEAVVNGLRRVLRDAESYGVTTDAAVRSRFEQELVQSEAELVVFRERIVAQRREVVEGRARVGFGDESFAQDARARQRFNEIARRELQGALGGAGGDGAKEYARSAQPILGRIDAAEAVLADLAGKLERQVGLRAQDLAGLIAAEGSSVEAHSRELDELDAEGRQLIGQAAMLNFAHVRDRLKHIVLKADVGIAQQAWEIREEQQTRVRELQRERAAEEKQLDDELREVLDDSPEAR